MSTCVSALLSLKFQEWKVRISAYKSCDLSWGWFLITSPSHYNQTDQKLNPGQCLWTKRGLMYCSWFDIHNYFFFVRLMLCQNSYNGHGQENLRLYKMLLLCLFHSLVLRVRAPKWPSIWRFFPVNSNLATDWGGRCNYWVSRMWGISCSAFCSYLSRDERNKKGLWVKRKCK